ncbi:unnamed protein product, partial [Effrenium voratum]
RTVAAQAWSTHERCDRGDDLGLKSLTIPDGLPSCAGILRLAMAGDARSRASRERRGRRAKAESSAQAQSLRTRVVVCGSLVLVGGAFVVSEASLTTKTRAWAGVFMERTATQLGSGVSLLHSHQSRSSRRSSRPNSHQSRRSCNCSNSPPSHQFRRQPGSRLLPMMRRHSRCLEH